MRPVNPGSISKVLDVLTSFYKVFRANISFGSALTYASDGSIATYSQDNTDGTLIRVAPNANPLGLTNSWSGSNSNTTLYHNLGRIPLGYIATKKSITCDIYDGTVVATTQTITLKCTDGSADTVIYIF